MSNKDADEIRVPLWAKCFFVLFLFALFAVAAIFVYKYYLTFQGEFFPTKNRENWGTFGDFFGGMLNPIFGLASFLALLATIFYQSKELKASTKELKHSAEALTKQNRAIELQSFEQTFFSWMSTYRELLGEIRVNNNIQQPIFAKEALRSFWDNELDSMVIWRMMCEVKNSQFQLKSKFGDYGDALQNMGDEKKLEVLSEKHSAEIVESIYDKWTILYNREKYQLDSFFRTAYKLLTWIDSLDSSRLSNKDKWLYISIFRSQLSWIELVFFFYNGLTEAGEKFKPIIEKYALFDNLDLESDVCIKIVQQNNNSTNRYADLAFSSDLAKQKLGI